MPSVEVYSGPAVRIGRFISRPGDADFDDSGPTRGHLLVFPREPVTITHAGREPIVADPSVVMIYNRGQEYARAAISPAGDRCEWFAYPADAVLDARHGTDATEERPFGSTMRAASDARTYLLARLAYEHVLVGDADHLLVEEVAATLLDHVIGHIVGSPAPAAIARTHRELADATQRSVALQFAEHHSLAAIARELGVSGFHLARVFRRATGRSIHGYRTELRVRAAVERLADAPDLSDLALELGFASHSHFTLAFRRAFGVAPSQLRRDPRAAVARLRARS